MILHRSPYTSVRVMPATESTEAAWYTFQELNCCAAITRDAALSNLADQGCGISGEIGCVLARFRAVAGNNGCGRWERERGRGRHDSWENIMLGAPRDR